MSERRGDGARRLGLFMLAAPAALALIAIVAALTVGRGDDEGGEGRALTAELRSERPGGPLGLASVEGERVRLVVWGLEPGTTHLVEVGPTCEEADAGDTNVRPIGRVAADATGVGFGRLALEDADGLDAIAVRSGARGGVRVSCGIVGSTDDDDEIADVELAGAGPGAAAAVGANALVELRAGRVVGGVRTLAVAPGAQLALALRADRPGEVRVESSALRFQVGPDSITRVAFSAPRRTGPRRVLGPDGATVLLLDVREPPGVRAP